MSKILAIMLAKTPCIYIILSLVLDRIIVEQFFLSYLRFEQKLLETY